MGSRSPSKVGLFSEEPYAFRLYAVVAPTVTDAKACLKKFLLDLKFSMCLVSIWNNGLYYKICFTIKLFKQWILFGPDKRIGILNRKKGSVHERKFGILPG